MALLGGRRGPPTPRFSHSPHQLVQFGPSFPQLRLSNFAFHVEEGHSSVGHGPSLGKLAPFAVGNPTAEIPAAFGGLRRAPGPGSSTFSPPNVSSGVERGRQDRAALDDPSQRTPLTTSLDDPSVVIPAPLQWSRPPRDAQLFGLSGNRGPPVVSCGNEVWDGSVCRFAVRLAMRLSGAVPLQGSACRQLSCGPTATCGSSTSRSTMSRR